MAESGSNGDSEEKKETQDELRIRLLKEQALKQIEHDPSAVDVLMPDGETVKGLFTSGQTTEDSMGNTRVGFGQLGLTLYIDHAKTLYEKNSEVVINEVMYRVLRVFIEVDLSLGLIVLVTVRQ